jgi:hypothetical protein
MSSGIHHRGVLALIPADTDDPELQGLRDRARCFFLEYSARGYGCFRPLANELLRQPPAG